MSRWLDTLIDAPFRTLCAITGHDFKRHDRTLICQHCGMKREIT